MSELTPEQKAIARQKFADGEACVFCGGFHLRFCPRVRELELDGDGRPKRIVYWQEGSWSDEHVIWPEMIADEEDEDERDET